MIYKDNSFVEQLVLDVTSRCMVETGKCPTKVFISSDLFQAFDIPLEIDGFPVYEHPAGGTFAFCAS